MSCKAGGRTLPYLWVWCFLLSPHQPLIYLCSSPVLRWLVTSNYSSPGRLQRHPPPPPARRRASEFGSLLVFCAHLLGEVGCVGWALPALLYLKAISLGPAAQTAPRSRWQVTGASAERTGRPHLSKARQRKVDDGGTRTFPAGRNGVHYFHLSLQ